VKGSATAFKAMLRDQFAPRRDNDKWSDSEKMRIRSIHGQSINSASLKLIRSEMPRRTSLWIGPRIGLRKRVPDALSPEGISFRDAPLRIATWKMDGKMREIDI
jgi:hypothetical protein